MHGRFLTIHSITYEEHVRKWTIDKGKPQRVDKQTNYNLSNLLTKLYVKRIHGILPNLVVLTITVYNICRKQSRFSCVSTIYFFVGALMWITASLDLHVCKELMDLPPFRRPRNTQTIWNIPSRKKNVFEKPQFWKKNEVKNWIHSW